MIFLNSDFVYQICIFKYHEVVGYSRQKPNPKMCNMGQEKKNSVETSK